MSPLTVKIAAELVPYLRRGVRRELGETLATLAFQIDTVLDRATYYEALSQLDDARALFDAVGVLDEPEQADLELELCRWPRLLVRVLESQYEIETMRLQDRAAEGVALPAREIPALGELVSDVRKKAQAPARGSGKRSGRQRARRVRRSRGDG